MWRNLISMAVTALLLVTTALGETSKAESKAEKEAKKEAKQVEKVKQKITKVGAGEKTRVTVELMNSQKVKGYVSKIDEDSFVVTDPETQASTKVAYRDVVHLSGKGLSKTVKIVIVAGVVLFLSLYISLVAYPAAASH
jgi:hypothetical protein